MQELYFSILELSGGVNIIEKANEKVDFNKSVYDYDGFTFKLIYFQDNFVQILVITENIHTTRLLRSPNLNVEDWIENAGIRIGIKLDMPIWLPTDGGCLGTLCDYLIVFSKEPVQPTLSYQSVGIGGEGAITWDEGKRIITKLIKRDIIADFEELQHYIEKDDKIWIETKKMITDIKLYEENFRSIKTSEKQGAVTFEENEAMLAAKRFAEAGRKTAVLNFANPVEPGGGVLRGGKAQEESICRVSNLYKALISEQAKKYYVINSSILNENQFNSIFLGTDLVLYISHVMVLKGNEDYHHNLEEWQVYKRKPYYIDVITCAAPFFSGSGYMIGNGDLQHIYEKRIRNILETAIENEIEVLVLGAFGCGAFHNPPFVVAKAFKKVLLEERYRRAFEQIVFAVVRKDIICANVEAFEESFSKFPEINKDGRERYNRLHAEWECTCGCLNSWDIQYCQECNNNRKNHQSIYFKSYRMPK